MRNMDYAVSKKHEKVKQMISPDSLIVFSFKVEDSSDATQGGSGGIDLHVTYVPVSVRMWG